MRTIIALLLCTAAPVQADVPSDPVKDTIIANVVEQFWSPSDPNRGTVPVPTSVAYRAIEAGQITAEGVRCDIRIARHINSISASARKLGMTETQVAFVNSLHDAGMYLSKSPRMYPCDDHDDFKARRLVDRSKRMGLEVATVAQAR
jgi:hypothetical protein